MVSTPSLGLVSAETVEILILMDNYSDNLLPSGSVATRPRLAPGGEIPATTLLAEHGLSLLITARGATAQTRFLLDAGYTDKGVPHNLDLLGVDLADLEAVVLSHGHMDHYGSLAAVLERASPSVPVVMHPAVLEGSRYLDRPGQERARFPRLSRELVASLGERLLLTSEPYLGSGRLWGTTGEVARETPFEKGLPGALRERDGQLVPDLMEDDLAVVLHLAGKGLVVISGCAHAGIVNTVHCAQRLTGVDEVYAVLGGFHLGGPAFADALGPTVDALRDLHPEVLVPMHCTGHAATYRLAEAFGEAFVLSSVGTTLHL
ncbi:MAG TPA: MBL fold metallo-hydrolase [Deferrisomatales bacterium]|nr:MBL fold metallo-hydrolase [Deferrisomatales bacterium]